MAGRPTARRYAQAVFALAIENDAIDQWSSDLDLIADAVGDDDFHALLEAPQVPETVKFQGIDTVLAGASQLARNLLSVLVDHRAVRFVPRIRAQYQALVDQHQGRARGAVVTAVPLEDAQRLNVQQLLGELVGTEVVMTESVDPAIVGGIVARVGDHLIDGSVRTRLIDMRTALAHPPVESTEESA